MTRRRLILGLLAAPFTTMAVAKPSAAATKVSGKTIVFPPGVYRIAPGGGVRVVGSNDIYIKGCVFDAIKSQALSPGRSRSLPAGRDAHSPAPDRVKLLPPLASFQPSGPV